MKRAPSLSGKKPTTRLDVDSELESALLAASTEGDVDKVRQVADRLVRKQEVMRVDALEELFACAFARAAGANQVAAMELLLAMGGDFPTLEGCVSALEFGVCRSERLFPPVIVEHETHLHCCSALRYVGYAAVMSVEHNAMSAMRFLLEKELLDDSEVLRCYTLAKLKAIRFDAPNPGAYRSMLLLLIAAFPSLLDVRTSSAAACGEHASATAERQRTLESSLVYEYALNRNRA